MSAKWLFTFKHFIFPLLPLLTHSALVYWSKSTITSLTSTNQAGAIFNAKLGMNCTRYAGAKYLSSTAQNPRNVGAGAKQIIDPSLISIV